jgi:hypothetical protein
MFTIRYSDVTTLKSQYTIKDMEFRGYQNYLGDHTNHNEMPMDCKCIQAQVEHFTTYRFIYDIYTSWKLFLQNLNSNI